MNMDMFSLIILDRNLQQELTMAIKLQCLIRINGLEGIACTLTIVTIQEVSFS